MGQFYSLQLILKGEELRNLPRGALDKQQDDVLWAAWCVAATQGEYHTPFSSHRGSGGELNFR